MLVHEFMEHFVAQAEAVEGAIAAAASEINSVSLPEDVGSLRVSHAEIYNIVTSACDYTFRAPDEMTSEEKRNQDIIAEGLEELVDELFLQQFAETMDEVMASFHNDLVTIMRHNPLLMGDLHPVMKALKTGVTTALARHKKFQAVIQVVEAAQAKLDASREDIPDYVIRILDEIADFSECLLLPMMPTSGGCPEAVNDNRPAA